MTITIKSTNTLHVPSLFAGLKILAKKDFKAAYWTLALTCKTMPGAMVQDVLKGACEIHTNAEDEVVIEWSKPTGSIEDYCNQGE